MRHTATDVLGDVAGKLHYLLLPGWSIHIGHVQVACPPQTWPSPHVVRKNLVCPIKWLAPIVIAWSAEARFESHLRGFSGTSYWFYSDVIYPCKPLHRIPHAAEVSPLELVLSRQRTAATAPPAACQGRNPIGI